MKTPYSLKGYVLGMVEGLLIGIFGGHASVWFDLLVLFVGFWFISALMETEQG